MKSDNPPSLDIDFPACAPVSWRKMDDLPDKHTHRQTITNKLRSEIASFAAGFEEPCYLEVGFDRGYTMASLAGVFSELHGIDILSRRVEDAQALFATRGITNASVTRGDSSTILKRRYDVVLIDARHTYEDVKRDTINVLENNTNRDRFVIVFHDYGLVDGGVGKFCDQYWEESIIPAGEESDWNPLGGPTDGPEAVACVVDGGSRERFLARIASEAPEPPAAP